MRRVRPHQVVFGIGLLVAVFTLASGVMPALTHWGDTSHVRREVFVNVPTAMKVAFYAAVATMLLLVGWLASLRVRNYERGTSDDRRTTRKNAKRRFRDYRAGVLMQTLLRDPAAGLMHSFLYFGFVGLFMVTVVLEVDHQMPDALKFLHGRTYEAFKAGANAVGVLFLIGVVWAIVRRYVQRPYRIRIKTRPEDAVILGTFARHRAHRILRRSGTYRVRSTSPYFEKWSFVGYRPRQSHRHVADPHAPAACTAGCGACTWWRSSRSSRSCPRRSCGTCSRHR